MNANIGQYDAENGVYRISIFAPGIYFPYSNYALVMDNAADFHEWKIPVAEARKIREQSPYGDVIVEVTLLPFGVQLNNQRHVRGQITDVKVFEDRSGQLIHSAAIADDQKRDVQVGANAAPTLLDVRLAFTTIFSNSANSFACSVNNSAPSRVFIAT
ncbi:hypothetical protein BZA02_10813 [Ruegeria sp. P4]|nr:hypothetical protein BZA02_10813 [Ruegeria sp. P4]